MPYRGTYAVKAKPHFFARGASLSSLTQPDPPSAITPFTATKLVATTGPSCQDVSTLQAMLLKGVSAFRLDLTWGSLDFHLKTLSNLQAAMLTTRRMAACIVDTMGREILLRRRCQPDGSTHWPVHEEAVDVELGQAVVLSSEVFDDHKIVDGRIYFSVSYDKFPSLVQMHDKIWISRYLSGGSDTPTSLCMDVVAVSSTEVVCVAQNNACLEGLLTVFHAERSDHGLENLQNDLPVLSDYDKACLKELSKKYEIDFISLSYTKTTQDVLAARLVLDEIGMSTTRILAKVEVRQALFNFNGILNASDGIILSRGNLGLDCLPEKMAMLQKSTIQACNLVGKPVLVTRFMDSMTKSPRPTRAESTDVANAVLDGLDGMLLGAETVRGLFPLQTVEIISQIAREAEKVFDYRQHYDHLMQTALDIQQLDEAMGEVDGSDDCEVDSDVPLRNPLALSGAPRSVQFISDNTVAHTTETFRPGSGHFDTGASGLEGLAADGHNAPAEHRKGEGIDLKHSSRSKSLGTLSQAIRAMNINNTAETVGLTKPPLPATYPSRLPPSGARGHLPGGRSPPGSTLSLTVMSRPPSDRVSYYTGLPFLSKMESITSSAVRVAEKVAARLILVLTHTTSIAQLLSKYRPPMPILTLVVPNLISDGLSWKLEGRTHARHCLLIRGVLPMLAAPSPGTDELLDEAVATAARMGLVLPNDHVVCVERLCSEEFSVKVIGVDAHGTGVRRDQSARISARSDQRGYQRRRPGLFVDPPASSHSPPAFGVASTRPVSMFGSSTITPKGCNPFVGTRNRPTPPWRDSPVDRADYRDDELDQDMLDAQDLPRTRPLIHTMSSLANGLEKGYMGRDAGRGAVYRSLSPGFIAEGKVEERNGEGEEQFDTCQGRDAGRGAGERDCGSVVVDQK